MFYNVIALGWGIHVRTIMEKKRLIGLDIFRIIAAFVVYMYHAALLFNCDFGIFRKFANMGALFMTGFFLLSGFVIFSTNKQQDLMKVSALTPFYLKRFVGLMPPYCFITLVYIFFYSEETVAERLYLAPIEFLGIQTAFPQLSGVFHNGGTWFISCLLLCYLLYPFFQEIVKQLSTKGKIIIIIVCCIIQIVYPIVAWKLMMSLYSNPFFRIPEFFIGVALGSLAEDLDTQKIPEFFFSLKAFAVELALLVVCITLTVDTSNIVKDCTLYNWITLPFVIVMLLSLSRVECTNRTAAKVIRYLSAVTYSFYLVQFFIWNPVRSVLNRLGREDNWLKIGLSFGACLVLSILLYEIVEKPCTKYLKKKLKNAEHV